MNYGAIERARSSGTIEQLTEQKNEPIAIPLMLRPSSSFVIKSLYLHRQVCSGIRRSVGHSTARISRWCGYTTAVSSINDESLVNLYRSKFQRFTLYVALIRQTKTDFLTCPSFSFTQQVVRRKLLFSIVIPASS